MYFYYLTYTTKNCLGQCQRNDNVGMLRNSEQDMVDLSLILLKNHFINGELLRCAPSTKTSSIYEYFTLSPP